MLCLLQEQGQGRLEYTMGLFFAVIIVLPLIACVCCAILLLLGPQIGNVFSRITSGLLRAG